MITGVYFCQMLDSNNVHCQTRLGFSAGSLKYCEIQILGMWFLSSVPQILKSSCLCLKHCLQCFDAVGWAAGRAGTKTEWWVAGVVVCLERGADLHVAQLMPLPLTVSCFSKIKIDFTFLVPAHLGSPGQRAVKRVHVCVRVLCLKHLD